MAAENWPLVPLGELTENFDGRRVPVKEIDRKPGPYPYYGASGIVDRVDGYLFDGEFLLIGEDGENLRTRQTPIAFMATGKFWVNNHAHIVRGNSRADTRFLSYVLSQTDISGYLTGSTMPKLTQGNLNRLPVIAPPIAEQRAIASILGALDDKIELNRRMNATLEAIARALFQSWFVDFDPVRAKLDGCKPAGLDEATAGLFPGSFEASPLGLIPDGWRAGSIYEIASVIYGAPFASSLFNSRGEGKALIRIRDLADESPAVWTTEVHPKGYIVRAGDIVVGMDGEFRAFLWGGEDAWLNQRVCVFAPKPGFSAAFVRNTIFEPLAQIEATETATTVIHLGKNDIDRFVVVIPDEKVREAFARICQPLYDQIVANKQQSRTLAALRDTLLPKLLSGELRVPLGN
jgi:type I restriction enzyme, S subunit